MRMGRVAAGCRGDIAPAVESEEQQDGIANGGQGLRRRAGMDLAAVFAERLIPNVVDIIGNNDFTGTMNTC